AVLLDDLDDAGEAGRVGHRDHLQRFEGAALDALLAAGAALLVDEGDGTLVLLQHPLHVAVLVEDGVDRAHRPARSAIDAEVRRDEVQRLALAGDGVGRTALHAGGAADAGFDDAVGHRSCGSPPITIVHGASPRRTCGVRSRSAMPRATGSAQQSWLLHPPSGAGGTASGR